MTWSMTMTVLLCKTLPYSFFFYCPIKDNKSWWFSTPLGAPPLLPVALTCYLCCIPFFCCHKSTSLWGHYSFIWWLLLYHLRLLSFLSPLSTCVPTIHAGACPLHLSHQELLGPPGSPPSLANTNEKETWKIRKCGSGNEKRKSDIVWK